MNNDKKKIGLALSGGGYRAAAYHVGTLRALHKLGILNKVDVISIPACRALSDSLPFFILSVPEPVISCNYVLPYSVMSPLQHRKQC